MNSEWKQKWVEALRSGEYKQGKYGLRSADDAFCCLGVLCDLIEPTRWQLDKDRAQYTNGYAANEHAVGILPDDISSALGLDRGEQAVLGTMNDTGNSFNDIADWIEENL